MLDPNVERNLVLVSNLLTVNAVDFFRYINRIVKPSVLPTVLHRITVVVLSSDLIPLRISRVLNEADVLLALGVINSFSIERLLI